MNSCRLFLLATLSLAFCSPKPTEIVRLDIRDSSFVEKPVPSTRVMESYVVVSPPETDSMNKLALRYSQSLPNHYPTQDIWVDRGFYKETRYTPQDFKETKERNGRLDAHGEDLLVTILHLRSATMDCWFVSLPAHISALPLSPCIRLDSARPPSEPIRSDSQGGDAPAIEPKADVQ